MEHEQHCFLTDDAPSIRGSTRVVQYTNSLPVGMRGEEASSMIEQNPIDSIRSELQEGMGLPKCQKCGCMRETLETMQSSMPAIQADGSIDLVSHIKLWLTQLEPTKYACLGCAHCYPAEAMNALNQSFPDAVQGEALACAFEVREQAWPAVPGEYHAFCEGDSCPVAVSTLASVDLADKLANVRPSELCIVGKTETENIGIDKVVKNTITNPTIRYLIVAGQDPKGHYTGKTLVSLWENGVDESARVIGSPGKRPILRNVSRKEIDAFRQQVQVVDLIGCEDVETIVDEIKKLSEQVSSSCGCGGACGEVKPVQASTVSLIQATEPTKIELDKAGYFVILPQSERGVITVENYAYDNSLLRVIEGTNARNLYWTIIENGWVTQLSHAAYLGKELTKAELSMGVGFKYVQDGA